MYHPLRQARAIVLFSLMMPGQASVAVALPTGPLCKSYSGLPSGFPASDAGMLAIPAGSFLMGSDHDYPEERPVQKVSVAAFQIDSHEVTNAEFAAFVAATRYVTTAELPLPADKYPGLPDEYRVPGSMVFVMPQGVLEQFIASEWWRFTPGANWRQPSGPDSNILGRDNEPVTQVSWQDAKAYFDTAEDGYHGTAPVGCFQPNAYGLHDMLGNVWEWTLDVYQPRHDAPSNPLPTPGLPEQRVIKGGSWLCSTTFCGRYRPSARQPGETDLGSNHIGFRTVKRVQP